MQERDRDRAAGGARAAVVARARRPWCREWTLELTTARYLTPKGRAITGKGIVPDVPAMPGERAALDAALGAAKPGGPDPEVELAFEMVKAARIVLREPWREEP